MENTELQDKQYNTLATIFLSTNWVSFNFMEWSKSGQIPIDYHFSLPLFGDAVDQENLVSSLFETVETEINWEFITDGVIFKPTVRDGFGVDRVDFLLTADRKQHHADIDIEKITVSEDLIWKALLAFMKAKKIDDFLYLEANTSSIVLWRMRKNANEILKISTSKQDSDQPIDEIKVSNVKVDWENIENKTKNELWQRLRPFLTTSQPETDVKDIWANLMFSPRLHYESVLAQDVLRADLTANLNAIKNSAISSLSDFGAVPGIKSVFLCSGDLAVSMDEPNILLALIDGLGLFGNVQILIDRRDIFLSTALFNIDHEGLYSSNISSLIGKKYTLISVEPVGSGDQDEIIVEGTVKRGQVKRDIFGLRNRIHRFIIEKPSVLTIYPVKGENIGGIEGYSVHKNLEGEVILDTRDHDEIHYGPEPKNNANRVHAWLSGLR